MIIQRYCGADFQSAFQSYVDGNGTSDHITSPVQLDSDNISGDLQLGILAADAVVPPRQQETRLYTSQFSDACQQQQSSSKLNLSSQLLRCSSSSHSSHSVVSVRFYLISLFIYYVNHTQSM